MKKLLTIFLLLFTFLTTTVRAEGIVTSMDQVGNEIEKAFNEASPDDCNICAEFYVNDSVKTQLKQSPSRTPKNKTFVIRNNATLNNKVVADIMELNDDGFCRMDIRFFTFKEDLTPILSLEQQIKSQISGLSDAKKVDYLNQFIAKRISYDYSKNISTAEDALIAGKGICSAYTELFQILGEASGLQVGTISGNDYQHTWNYVFINGTKHYIDTTWNDIGSSANKEYFGTSPLHRREAPNQYISRTHNPSTVSKPVEKPKATPKSNAPRISGRNRYLTSIEISKRVPNKNIILVSGENYQDAAIVASLDEKILIHPNKGIDQSVINEINRNGGTVSVLSSLVNNKELINKINPQRTYANNYKDSAIQILKQSNASSFIVVSDKNFTDCLTIGSFAHKEKLPIIFDSQLNEIKNIPEIKQYTSAYIIGGDLSVTNNAESILASIGISSERISGRDRYETAKKVMMRFFPDVNNAYIATGEVFVDSLALASLAGTENKPILLDNANRTKLNMNINHVLVGGNTYLK